MTAKGASNKYQLKEVEYLQKSMYCKLFLIKEIKFYFFIYYNFTEK